MKTVSINVYSFDELSETSKQKAIDEHLNFLYNTQWWDYVYGDAENVGLIINGFDLYCKSIDVKLCHSMNDTIDKIFEHHGEETDTYILATGYKILWTELVSKYSDGVDNEIVTEENEEKFDELADSLEAGFTKELGKLYLKMLKEESEELGEYENIAENIRMNEYEFLSDGSLFNEKRFV